MLQTAMTNFQFGDSKRRTVFSEEILESLVTGKNDAAIIQRFHALAVTAKRSWNLRNMDVNDSLVRGVTAELNSKNEFGSDWDFVKGRHCTDHRDTRHHLVLNGGMCTESLNAHFVVAVEGGDCLRNELRLWIRTIHVPFIFLDE